MTANISPLAQTFKIDDSLSQGCFVSSVDLFFAVNDITTPVELQIVKTENGYPTTEVVPAARVVMGGDKISASSTSLVATKFKFPTLVYLPANTEFALKVITNSIKYKLWTSVMGQARVDNPAVLITKQPATGSLFKSQNNSTWTPEQTQDLTFRINRAKFNTNVIGNVTLTEAPYNNMDYLPANPFKTTNASATVKVTHYSHGLAAGMNVAYIDSTDTAFNTTFIVQRVINSDSYTINLPANATASNSVGGSFVVTEKNIRYDSFRISGVPALPEASSSFTVKMASDTAIDSTATQINTSSII
jgi:hypothetical protein